MRIEEDTSSLLLVGEKLMRALSEKGELPQSIEIMRASDDYLAELQKY